VFDFLIGTASLITTVPAGMTVVKATAVVRGASPEDEILESNQGKSELSPKGNQAQTKHLHRARDINRRNRLRHRTLNIRLPLIGRRTPPFGLRSEERDSRRNRRDILRWDEGAGGHAMSSFKAASFDTPSPGWFRFGRFAVMISVIFVSASTVVLRSRGPAIGDIGSGIG
jgi:hypothetical protein